ncbi:hypothetical protein HNP73_003126 [Amaricoccus macauensis]|uniref:PKD domain-containing protein n=1 Tax=Amaricoccus macauensis TaxID=57001 RepID=A0A840SJA8_9RHOB|nr:carboxypeptidase-like regulatory domain-containing protein [Amaricoccus macauensis]MBB5223179.1 hypothetical protein [Amaricoccus macauensis]
MSQPLIGEVLTTPMPIAPGGSCEIEIRADDGNAFDEDEVTVRINGLIGAKQVFQADKPGKRRLLVHASARDGRRESKIIEIEVAGEPLQFSHGGLRLLAMLHFTPVLARPYELTMELGDRARSLAFSPLTVRHARLNTASSQDLITFGKQLAQSRGLSRKLGRSLTRLRTTAPARTIRRSGSDRLSTISVSSSVFDLERPPEFVVPTERYEWDFGDGTRVTTHVPTVNHDFFPAMDHGRESTSFEVSCRAVHSNVTVRRSIVVSSSCAAMRRRGFVVPHVVADVLAHKDYGLFSGLFKASMVVHNVEPAAISLDQVAFTPYVAPDSTVPQRQFVRLGQPLTIAARSSALINVNVPFVEGAGGPGSLPHDVTGFSVVYSGTAAGLPVRINATFDIPLREQAWRPPDPFVPPPSIDPGRIDPDVPLVVWPKEKWGELTRPGIDERFGIEEIIGEAAPVMERTSLTVMVPLGEIAAHPVMNAKPAMLRSARDGIAQRRAAGMLAEVLLKSELQNAAGAPGIPPLVFLGGPEPAGPVAEGQICDPHNISTADAKAAEDAQLVCQITGEVREALMPARWMNALRGDIVLSPGGDGLIGGMMTMVDPPQWYVHCGIMTQNYQQIAHSTCSQERLIDSMIGVIDDGSDGFHPGTLKYAWPGAIVQTVDQSVFNTKEEEFIAPPHPAPSRRTDVVKTYPISPFGRQRVGVTITDDMKMIPPLIVKPDPLLDTYEVRQRLQELADDCLRDAGVRDRPGKYHYRWYCYTDPSIGFDQSANDDLAVGTWSEGTLPSVCSSFIWLHARARNIHLESDGDFVTEPDVEVVDAGARVRAGTRNGLYTYTADERLAAGEHLYNTVYDIAYDKAGWLGEALTDAADDTANQFLNAFGRDDADGKDNDDWRQATDADAVSPDDILWWDGPERGGVYGFSEVAIFREPRRESYTLSRWKLVLTRGTVRGRVFAANGSPAAGARVELAGDKWDNADASGYFEISDVGFGAYEISASPVIEGVLQTVRQPISLDSADFYTELRLVLPEDRFRVAKVTADFYGEDDEWGADNEIEDPGPTYFELELGPDRLTNAQTLTYRWGGEVRVEYRITARWLGDNIIDIDVLASLYEGTSENSKDLEGINTIDFRVWPDQTAGATIKVISGENESDPKDFGQLTLSVTNARNDN